MGSSNLMIVSDFDQTLSKMWYSELMENERANRLNIKVENKKKHHGNAAMSVFLQSQKMSEHVRQKTMSNYQKFRPIEQDKSLSIS